MKKTEKKVFFLYLWLVIKIIFQRLSRTTLEPFSLLDLNCQIELICWRTCAKAGLLPEENENIFLEDHVINSRQIG